MDADKTARPVGSLTPLPSAASPHLILHSSHSVLSRSLPSLSLSLISPYLLYDYSSLVEDFDSTRLPPYPVCFVFFFLFFFFPFHFISFLFLAALVLEILDHGFWPQKA